ncbi:hypothetical protein ABI_18580 [Asticcacaulis biprosthecium C19]|uniref:Uncharacterized protein n=1 Tax=Asticcacaulis biprosthecium C19 TaxID=715226 RepID=F4QL43_9CAUL|nr:hypothetical protein ABI_18580 [Asticcacaulis biprosthecium C19]
MASLALNGPQFQEGCQACKKKVVFNPRGKWLTACFPL